MALRNQDYTDRELLYIVNDLSTDEGYASTSDIAERVFGDKAESNGERRYVGSRMAWMCTYGFCERDPDRPGMYKLTTDGHALMAGKLTKSVENALTKMTDADRTMILRQAAREVFSHAGPSQAFFRREYTYHFENRAKAEAKKKRTQGS